MAIRGAAGDTVIHNAAREPEIARSRRFLNACGRRARHGYRQHPHFRPGRTAARLYIACRCPTASRAGTLLCGAAITGGDVSCARRAGTGFVRSAAQAARNRCEIHLPQGGGVRAIAPKRLRAVRRIEIRAVSRLSHRYAGADERGADAGARHVGRVENVFEKPHGVCCGTVPHGRDIQISGRTAVIRGVKA